VIIAVPDFGVSNTDLPHYRLCILGGLDMGNEQREEVSLEDLAEIEEATQNDELPGQVLPDPPPPPPPPAEEE
jgi:hypothetical protein